MLVVEDDGLLAMHLESVLAEAGWEVVGPAARVGQALRLAATGPLDAAVLDIDLKGETSFPVAEALAAQRVPFVFLSGRHEPPPPPALAAAPFLRKPYRPKAVLAALVASTLDPPVP